MVCPIRIQTDCTGSPNRILFFCCDMCPVQQVSKGDIAANATCRMRVTRLLPFVDFGASAIFHSETQEFLIPAGPFGILKEYAETLVRCAKRIENAAREYPELEEDLYTDPLAAFENLERAIGKTRSRKLDELWEAIRATRLCILAKKLPAPHTPRKSIYELLFEIQIKPRDSGSTTKLQRSDRILDRYTVGPFKVVVSELADSPFEHFYQAMADVDESLASQIVRFLAAKLSHQQGLPQLLGLDDVISSETQDFQRFLSSGFGELNGEERDSLAIYATAQTLDLTKTMPLLLDDDVQEFYLDRPGDTFYLDHARWGRCRSNLAPEESELARITTRLRLESRHPLDQRNPSLKTELRTKFFHVRAAADIAPLAHNGIHLDFRKLRLRLLTLPELIGGGTLSIAAAAFLVLCMTMRINITICGEPASGKTTLANAVNLVTPSFWRCIDIEDALESVSTNAWGRHKVTFQVDPFDSLEQKRQTKSNEIVRLLHRSPDWVFLGEIQTAEHSAAMFHALSAGIRGIQTCHASSNEDLLLRWRIHHNIPQVCFRSLGLLVHMVRELADGRMTRRVAQISELDWQSHKPSLLSLYEWKKETGRLERLHEDVLTALLERTGKFLRVTNRGIRQSFEIYEKTLGRLVQEQRFTPSAVVEAFDQAYAGLHSGTAPIAQADPLRSPRRCRLSTVLG